MVVVPAKTIVKTYNAVGTKLAEFSIANGFNSSATGLAVLDVNYDGKEDIIFMSK